MSRSALCETKSLNIRNAAHDCIPFVARKAVRTKVFSFYFIRVANSLGDCNQISECVQQIVGSKIAKS